MKLNLGSGYEPHEGYINIDLNPNAPVDKIGPIFPLDFPDASVTDIRATNCLEHLPYRQSAAALAEWSRVLESGGTLYVITPDAGEIARWLVEEPHRLCERLPADLEVSPPVGAAWRLLGGQEDDEFAKSADDWRLNAHYALFTREYLTHLLDNAGFEVQSMETNIHPNLIVTAVKR